MDVLVKVTVPNYIYRFYRNASRHIAGCSPEKIMADALTAYAGLLSEEVAKERDSPDPDCGE
nr:hypothetical protein [Oscillospiraceae bacterium]